MISYIFFIWEHGEEKLKKFIDVLNKKHPTITFTGDRSKTKIEILDVIVSLENKKIKTDLIVKPADTHQYLHSSSCHPYHCKKWEFLIAKRSALIEFVKILYILIGDDIF